MNERSTFEEAFVAENEMASDQSGAWQILMHYSAQSVFRPEVLLREALRQKNLLELPVPEICVLGPDGDIVRHLNRMGSGSVELSALRIDPTVYAGTSAFGRASPSRPPITPRAECTGRAGR